MKRVKFNSNVDYGGFIAKGTQGTISDDGHVLSIPASSYGGWVLLGAREARFDFPIPDDAGYGDVMSKIDIVED